MICPVKIKNKDLESYMQKDWNINDVYRAIDSDIGYNNAEVIVNNFLAENGIFEDNPIFEYIDLDRLKKALLGEEVADAQQVAAPERPAMVKKDDSQMSGKFSTMASHKPLESDIHMPNKNVGNRWAIQVDFNINRTTSFERDQHTIQTQIDQAVKQLVKSVAEDYGVTTPYGFKMIQQNFSLIYPNENNETPLKLTAEGKPWINYQKILNPSAMAKAENKKDYLNSITIAFHPNTQLTLHKQQQDYYKLQHANQFAPQRAMQPQTPANQ